jgi:hypothetical protein
MKAVSLIFGLLFLSSPLWSRRIHPHQYEGGRSKDEHSAALRNSSALARVLGEYRAASSDVLLMKTENYLHSGVGYEMHVVNDPKAMSLGSEMAEKSGHQQEVGQVGDHADHAHEAGPAPMIKEATQDFRGFLGDWHRQVKPWNDPSKPHEHTDGRELLPWFRVMTLNNPHYVRAYAMGAWWLMQENLEEAVKFAEEGARNNPDSFLIKMVLAELQMTGARKGNGGSMLNPGPESLVLFRQAAATYLEAAKLAMAQRPPDFSRLSEDDPWRLWMDDDARRTVEMAVLTQREYVDASQAREWARQWAPYFPKSTSLARAAADSP